MAATVGPGILAKMREAGDDPVTNEFEFTAPDGATKQRRAFGHKGLYIASPDSGDWVVIGPLALAE